MLSIEYVLASERHRTALFDHSYADLKRDLRMYDDHFATTLADWEEVGAKEFAPAQMGRLEALKKYCLNLHEKCLASRYSLHSENLIVRSALFERVVGMTDEASREKLLAEWIKLARLEDEADEHCLQTVDVRKQCVRSTGQAICQDLEGIYVRWQASRRT